MFQPPRAEVVYMTFKKTPFPFVSQTFKEIFVRSLADYRDKRTETSVITHNKEYAFYKNSLKVTNMAPAPNKQDLAIPEEWEN